MHTIDQYELLAGDEIKSGIADTIVYTSPMLERLPFKTVSTNNVLYTWESTAAGVSWAQTGDTIVPSEGTHEQRSVELTILIGDADTDKFADTTRTDVNDIKMENVKKKSKALGHEFEKRVVIGRTSSESSTNQIYGLAMLLAQCEGATVVDLDPTNNDQVVSAADDSATLTIDMLDELHDTIRGGKPDAYVLSKAMRRKVMSLARAAGNNLQYKEGRLGTIHEYYGDVQLIVNDWMYETYPDGSSGVMTPTAWDPTTTRAAGNDNGIIFAVRFDMDGVCGLTNGGIQVEELGTLETKDATRTRIKFYCGLANFNKYAIAGLINVKYD